MIQKADALIAAGTRHIVASAARLSSCRRRQVGAAIFDIEANLIATGYNREAEDGLGGRLNCSRGECPRGATEPGVVQPNDPYSGVGACVATHAEMMALKKAELLTAIDGPVDLIMVVTHRPCHECTPVLERLGMQVFYLEEM